MSFAIPAETVGKMQARAEPGAAGLRRIRRGTRGSTTGPEDADTKKKARQLPAGPLNPILRGSD